MTPEATSTPDRPGHPAELAELLAESRQLSIWEAFHRSRLRRPDHPALVGVDGRTLTYEQVSDSVLRCAARLEDLGIRKGSVVAYLLSMSVDWAILHYALFRLGAVVVPLNISYEAPELADALARSRAEYLFAMASYRGVSFAQRLSLVDETLQHGSTKVEGLACLTLVHVLPVNDGDSLDGDSAEYRRVYGVKGDAALEPSGPVAASDPAIVLFTSGSTAKPKPTLLGHGGIVGCATALQFSLGLDEADRVIGYAPNFHVGGTIWTLLLPHLVGATCYVMPFDPDQILTTMEQAKITVFNGMDTHFTKLFTSELWGKRDISSVVKGNVGCTPSFMRRVEEAFAYTRIAQIYGSTESLGVLSITPRDEHDLSAIRETNGRPLPGMEVSILDPETARPVGPGVPGEICFRGWGRFIEYLDPPEESPIDADDYFHSGDYGWLDEDGNLYFRGRYKQMIRTGGENVAEREIEIFLETNFPELRHAEVVGVPDDMWGEAIVAFVQMGDGPTLSQQELRERCRGKIAAYKIPKRFVLLAPDENWPMLGSGRIDKPALRQRARELAPAAVMDDSYSVRR